MADYRQMITDCNHCGNRTRVDIISNYTYQEEVPEMNPSTGEMYEIFIYSDTWYFCKCPICNNIILIKSHFEPSMVMPNGDFYEHEKTLYPASTYKRFGVPDRVDSAFKAAMRSKFLDTSICLLSLRRTLEIICKDKGEEKGSLEKKLENLSTKGIIPSTLNQMSHIVRILGNEAAHGDDVIHTKSEVNDMLEFTEHIINYVYVLPYKLDKIKKRLEPK